MILYNMLRKRSERTNMCPILAIFLKMSRFHLRNPFAPYTRAIFEDKARDFRRMLRTEGERDTPTVRVAVENDFVMCRRFFFQPFHMVIERPCRVGAVGEPRHREKFVIDPAGPQHLKKRPPRLRRVIRPSVQNKKFHNPNFFLRALHTASRRHRRAASALSRRRCSIIPSKNRAPLKTSISPPSSSAVR